MKRIVLLALVLVLGTGLLQAQALMNRMAKMAVDQMEKSAESSEPDKTNSGATTSGSQTSTTPAENNGSSAAKNNPPAKSNGSNAAGMGMLSRMGMSSEPIPIEDAYAFSNSITANLKSYNAKGKLESDGDFITFITPGSTNFAYEFTNNTEGEQGKGFFIIDAKNSATIILSEDGSDKTGLVYGFKDYNQTSETSAETADVPDPAGYNSNLRKTGRSKKILGYTCDEYEYEDETSKASYWITNDLKMESGDYMSNIFKTSVYSHGMPWGYMLECNSTDKSSGDKSDYVVTDINPKANKKILLSEYQITNFGNMMMPAEK